MPENHSPKERRHRARNFDHLCASEPWPLHLNVECYAKLHPLHTAPNPGRSNDRLGLTDKDGLGWGHLGLAQMDVALAILAGVTLTAFPLLGFATALAVFRFLSRQWGGENNSEKAIMVWIIFSERWLEVHINGR